MEKKNDKLTFLLSDESVNTNGYRVLTEGIILDVFSKNPVMLYMHERGSGVIGRWENLRKEEGKLYGDAVFDESDEIGARVKWKVENGFLRACSIGLDGENIVFEEIDGINTATQSILIEASIVDFPSNANSVKLRKDGKTQNMLIVPKNIEDQNFKAKIYNILGLKDTIPEDDVFAIINDLKKTGEIFGGDELQNALTLGLISSGEYNIYLRSDKALIAPVLKDRREENEKRINDVIKAAISERKFNHCDIDFLRDVGLKMGVEKLKTLTEKTFPAPKILDEINKGKDKSNWTLRDYRKNAPLELKNDPGLYKHLVEQEKLKNGIQ